MFRSLNDLRFSRQPANIGGRGGRQLVVRFAARILAAEVVRKPSAFTARSIVRLE